MAVVAGLMQGECPMRGPSIRINSCLVIRNPMVPRLVRVLNADDEWHDLVLCKLLLACLGRNCGPSRSKRLLVSGPLHVCVSTRKICRRWTWTS